MNKIEFKNGSFVITLTESRENQANMILEIINILDTFDKKEIENLIFKLRKIQMSEKF